MKEEADKPSKFDAAYYKEYYEQNKWRFKQLHLNWMQENRLKWNRYQAWRSKVRYWEKKLVLSPGNEKFILKLNKIKDERPN